MKNREDFCEQRCREWLESILNYIQDPDSEYGVPDAKFLDIKGRLKTQRGEKHPTFRTMVDSWFAYRHHRWEGFVTPRSFGVQWLNKGNLRNPRIAEAMLTLPQGHFVSHAARHVLRNRTDEWLVKDHAVPLKVMKTELEELCPSSTEEVESYLLRRYRLGIITKDEDKKFLRPKPHLRESMPDGYAPEEVFGRYQHPLVAIQGEFPE